MSTYEEQLALAQERKERNERKARNLAFSRDLAAELGGVFTDKSSPDYDHHCQAAITVDGRTLYLGFTTAYGRPKDYDTVCVSGLYPSYVDATGSTHAIVPRDVLPYAGAPEIKACITRGAVAIAKDIKRRFLPEFVRVWDLCKARADSYTAGNQSVKQMAEDLARDFGTHGVSSARLGDHGATVYCVATVQVSTSGARFEPFYCSMAAARKILALLKADKSED